MIEIQLRSGNTRLLTYDESIKRWVRSKRNKNKLITRGTSIPRSLQVISLIFNKTQTLNLVLNYKTYKILWIEYADGEFNWLELNYLYSLDFDKPVSRFINYTIKS